MTVILGKKKGKREGGKEEKGTKKEHKRWLRKVPRKKKNRGKKGENIDVIPGK